MAAAGKVELTSAEIIGVVTEEKLSVVFERGREDGGDVEQAQSVGPFKRDAGQ